MPTKLGPHSFTGHADVVNYVRAGSPIVKLVDAFGLAEALLALNPHLLLIGQISETYNVMADAQQGQTPQAAAHFTIERHKKHYQRHPHIKIWEGPSDPDVGQGDGAISAQRLAWYSAYEAERLRLLADMGLRGVVGNFATGTPPLAVWNAFLPAVDACEQYQGFLGLHEFSSPWLWWQTGTFQPTNCSGRADIPGEGDTGWATLRYRKVYREILIPNGLGQVPLLITECGLGPIAGVCAHMSRGPWLTHIEFWHRHSGAVDPIAYWRDNPERDPERYYAEQWMWYDGELQNDDFVRGAAMFTVGGQRPWEHYDFSGRRITQHLLRYIRTQQTLTTPQRAHTVPLDSASSSPAVFSNLLINTGLEEGQAYFADETHERAVPAGWRLTYADAATPTEPGQTAPWGQPFTALINRHALITSEQPRLFPVGAYCWKISSADTPVWVQLTQGVSGLARGARYIFATRLLPDLWTVDGEHRLYPAEPLASEVRLRAHIAGQTFDSGWHTLEQTPPGEYTRLALDLAAPADYAELTLEVRGRWPWPMCAWYVAELSLTSA